MTDSGTKTHFHLTMRYFIGEAIKIFSGKDFKKELLKYSKKKLKLPNHTLEQTISEALKSVFINQIHNRINQELPLSLKNKLSLVTTPMRNKLAVYLSKIDSNLPKYNPVIHNIYPVIDDYINELCWDEKGEIDKIKIFKSVYNNKPKDKIYNNFHLFDEACDLCLGDYIELIWKNHCDIFSVSAYKLWNIVEKKIRQNELPNVYLLYYWKVYLLKKGGEAWLFKELDYSNDYKPPFNIDNNREMFFYSIMTRNIEASSFFLNKLNCYEKDLVLEVASQWFIEKRILQFNISSNSFNQTQQQFVDVLIFLLDNMTDLVERKHFLYKYHSTILKNCLSLNGFDFYKYCFM